MRTDISGAVDLLGIEHVENVDIAELKSEEQYPKYHIGQSSSEEVTMCEAYQYTQTIWRLRENGVGCASFCCQIVKPFGGALTLNPMPIATTRSNERTARMR